MNDYSAQQLTPSLGAEITGIDLSNDLSNEQLNQIYDDLIKYNVIFFVIRKSPLRNILRLQKALEQLKSHILYILM